VAYNTAGSATSAVAVLTVTAATPPTILTNPVSRSVAVGQTASFFVAASGSPPIFYQWQRSGSDLPGKTSPTLIITNTASADAGVSSRLLAAFLSWMQDRKAPVFVAATCNNVNVLPPELIRKGRFDELFFVDLPNQAERKQIFAIQLSKRKRNSAEFSLDRVAMAARGYSGAEIESVVQTALYAAYSQKHQLGDQHLLDAIQATVPLSTTRAEEIEALRQWAGKRAVPASTPDARAERA